MEEKGALFDENSLTYLSGALDEQSQLGALKGNTEQQGAKIRELVLCEKLGLWGYAASR